MYGFILVNNTGLTFNMEYICFCSGFYQVTKINYDENKVLVIKASNQQTQNNVNVCELIWNS